MKRILEHEVIHHGVEHSQYFQGCGVSCTRFDDVATGIGSSEREAFDDALDSLAQSDWDVSTIEGEELSDEDQIGAAREPDEEDDADAEPSELYVHVSVRVRGDEHRHVEES